MKRSIFLLFILLNLLSTTLFSLNLDVRIYASNEISEVNINIKSGKYKLINVKEDLKIVELYKNSKITIKKIGDRVSLWKNDEFIGTYDKLEMLGIGFVNTFEVEPIKPSLMSRKYDDNLKLLIKNSSLLIINNVELEHYIAGVVESEGGGSTRDIDFFLVQAITCRTYALNNIRKHHEGGYHLCDQTHCQVYKGRCKSSTVTMAVSQTYGKVIVGQDNKMISAAFHSNSGGQTENSEDVWTIETPYLKSIIDTFSLYSKHSTWQKVVEKDIWLDYFAKNYQYPIDDKKKCDKILNFEQYDRQKYFVDSIPLKQIRADFELKSTFFSVYDRNEFVLINGKGYGHGVGLSQEGAIRMVELGFTFEDIIKFYYKDVKIVNFSDLSYFFINFYN